MENNNIDDIGHIAITSEHLAKISFGLTTDQVNEMTVTLAHAEALTDVVRWYSEAKQTLEGKSGTVLGEPGELQAGTISTLLFRAVADIGEARKLIESAARIKASRIGSE